MNSRETRYLDLGSQGKSAWWRYLAGVTLILTCWFGLGLVPYAFILAPRITHPLAGFIAINFTILVMLAGLALAMRSLHRRPLLSLITPARRMDWRRVAQGAAAWTTLMLLCILIEHLLYPQRYALSFNAERFFVFMAVALVLTPLQTTTEELVFRGYVMQGAARLVKSPAAIAVMSAIVFTVPHLSNPEMGHGPVLLAASYFTIGLLLAIITLRDGRLELAIGVHAANNLVLVLVANYDGSVLVTESILTAREFDPAFSFASLVVGAVIFYGIFFGRRPG
jgi:membrane protease YdiL (CAAX protease family)